LTGFRGWNKTNRKEDVEGPAMLKALHPKKCQGFHIHHYLISVIWRVFPLQGIIHGWSTIEKWRIHIASLAPTFAKVALSGPEKNAKKMVCAVRLYERTIYN